MGFGYSRMTACGYGPAEAKDAGIWSAYPPKLSVNADIPARQVGARTGREHVQQSAISIATGAAHSAMRAVGMTVKPYSQD